MATRKAGVNVSKRKPALKLKMSRRSSAMTVQEAGRLGGLIGGRKGGLAVKRQRGVEFYQEIGKLGGERVRALIAAGRKATKKQRSRGARR
ncbi:MAG TPA: hypothetical protein VGH20_13995 [Myxococcales bacterium]|jgi:general stress protein YciG